MDGARAAHLSAEEVGGGQHVRGGQGRDMRMGEDVYRSGGCHSGVSTLRQLAVLPRRGRENFFRRFFSKFSMILNESVT